MSVRRDPPPRLRYCLAAALVAAGAAPEPSVAEEPLPYLVRQLTPSGEAASRVATSWALDPRGEWVAFVGDIEIAGADAVYALRRNGSAPHRLSPYAAANAIHKLGFSADGRQVIYQGDLEVDGQDEIWSVPPWGTVATAVKLNGAVTGAGVQTFALPRTGDRIVYIAETAAGKGVWSVPAAGPAGAGIRLDPDPVGDDYPQSVMFRPDGAGISILMVDPVAVSTRLFAVPVAGPAASAVLLADLDATGCPAAAAGFTADGDRLLFARLCSGGSVFNQLWSVPVTGPASAAVSLAGNFATGGAIKSVDLSPDGQRVVFVADKLVDERFEIWSVPIDGPAAAAVRLNPSLVAGGDVKTNFRISPDSTRVAYIADQASDERFFPYSVPIDGPSTSAASLYQGLLNVAADAQELEFTPDGSGVVFRFDLAVDERFDLYWAPADASAVQSRITNRGSNPAPARSVSGFWFVHPDGERVFYTFDESAPGDRRGLGEQRIVDPYTADARWNTPPVAGGQVTLFALFPDAQGLVYRSDEVVDEKFELFTVDTRILGDGFESGDFSAWSVAP